jgi:hypothetical protein
MDRAVQLEENDAAAGEFLHDEAFPAEQRCPELLLEEDFFNLLMNPLKLILFFFIYFPSFGLTS